MNETLPSPSSQMGKKNLSGFTKFTKEMRPLSKQFYFYFSITINVKKRTLIREMPMDVKI